MTGFDHLFALLLLIGLPAYAAWEVPQLARRVVADPVHARTNEYRLTIALQWALVLVVVAVWLQTARAFDDLGVRLPSASSRWWTIAILVPAVAFFAFQAYTVARSAEARTKVRAQLDAQPSVRVLLPTRVREMRTFAAVAVTAGVCEEVLYRGYLLYYFRQWLPDGAAVAAAVAAFGLAHAYQGSRGIVLTTVAGAAAMGLYLFTGSLLAPVVLHAAVDLAHGYMGYLVMAGTETAPGQVPDSS